MLFKKFFRYAAPSVVSMWIFSLYTIVDGIFVAKGVGPDALAAVNLSLPFTNLMFAAGLLFATGTSTLISMALGRGEAKKANDYFNQNMVVTGAISLGITALALIFLEPIIRFLGATAPTLDYTREYVSTIAWFSIFFIISYNLEVMVKVDGAPYVSAIGVTSCALMNVALDYVFVMRFGWGVTGAALATGLAQVTSTCIFLIYFIFRRKKLSFGRFTPEWGILKRVIPIGLSDGITELSNGIIIFLFNRTILRVVGEPGLVSYTVVSYVNTFVLMTMAGITQGIQPLISLHYGMEDRKSMHTFLRYGLTSCLVLGGAVLAVSQLGAGVITGLFIDARLTELFDATVRALRLFSPVFLMMGVNVVGGGFFAAVAQPSRSLTISLGRGLVLLAVSLLAMTALFGVTGIWLSPTVAEGLCLITTLFFFRRYRRELDAPVLASRRERKNDA